MKRINGINQPSQGPTLEVKLCPACFALVERYQDPKEILRQLQKHGCAKCKLMAYAKQHISRRH